jgi:excisionase family DNA binding protein
MVLSSETHLSPTQAARRLDVSYRRVIQLADEGSLAAIRTPIGRIFARADVERLAAERARRSSRS